MSNFEQCDDGEMAKPDDQQPGVPRCPKCNYKHNGISVGVVIIVTVVVVVFLSHPKKDKNCISSQILLFWSRE